jgi:putative ATP-dependent endonuclease of the OLD family
MVVRYVYEPIPLRIEVVLIDLSTEIDTKCGGHVEFWHLEEKRLLGLGEAANPLILFLACGWKPLANTTPTKTNSRLKTFFTHSPDAPVGEPTTVPKPVKRLFGFLYLRALRTGSRAKP